jgi:hypothetical protein
MLLANELESITLLDGTTQALDPAARDAFPIFEDLYLLGNGERPQFLRLEYLHKTFTLELIESVLTNHHELFPRCVSPPLIRDLYASSCPRITLMFTAFRALNLITTPPFPPAPQRSPSSAFPLALHGTRVVFLLLRLKQFSSKLETEAEVILTLLIKLIGGETDAGEPRPVWMRVLAAEIMHG